MKEKHNKISYNHKDMEKISDTVLVVGKKKKKAQKIFFWLASKKKRRKKQLSVQTGLDQP